MKGQTEVKVETMMYVDDQGKVQLTWGVELRYLLNKEPHSAIQKNINVMLEIRLKLNSPEVWDQELC